MGYRDWETDITLVAGYYLVKFDFVTLDSGRLNLTVSLGGQTVSALGAPLGTGFVSQSRYAQHRFGKMGVFVLYSSFVILINICTLLGFCGYNSPLRQARKR